MFKDVIISSISTRLKVKKGLIMIFSFLFHSTIIFAVFIGPLLETDTAFSKIKVVDVFLTQAPPQAPKAIRGREPVKQKPKSRILDQKNPEKKAAAPQIDKLIVPDIIPDIIEDDEPWENDDSDIDLGPDIEGTAYDEGLKPDDTLPWDPPAKNPGTTRISVKQARRIDYVRPIYPEMARRAHIRFATVIIEAKTDVFGNVVEWKIKSGHPLFNSSAVNAIKKWKYEPYMVGGIPKPVIFTVTINFTLAK